MKTNNKKRFFPTILLIFVGVIALMVYIWYSGTFKLHVEETVIKSDKISEEMTVLQLSDLHGSFFGNGNKDLLEEIDEINPNFIFITGDVFTSEDENGKRTALGLMKTLEAKYFTCYVTGEHDNDSLFHSELIDAGVRVLHYNSVDFKQGDDLYRIYGINNVYYSDTFDLSTEFTLDKNCYNILLAHNCNPEAFKKFGADLTLCGDTHGGQIRLPFVGAVKYEGQWFPEMGADTDQYIKGHYKLGKNDLYISPGLGNYPYPIRIDNPPELSVIKLVPEKILDQVVDK